jgi:CRISPR-associated endonuclease/helicase Cas3
MPYLARLVGENGQLLSEHLTGVARLTTEALPEVLREVGWYAGLWHDLGKYIEQWQLYLRGNNKRVNHSAQGAMLALELCQAPNLIPALAYVIAGHHAGLKNPSRLESKEFEQDGNNWQEAVRTAQQEINKFLPNQLPDINLPPLRREFAIRMLFSALVDADRLDAMQFEQKYQNPQKLGVVTAFESLSKSFNPRSLANFNPQSLLPAPSEINRLRNVFAEYCIAAAASPKGLFRLTGACGIGKTKSSLRFGLIHAQQNALRRIIYVGSFTSIIEQTAAVYRDLLRAENVLEHHSGFDPPWGEQRNYKLDTERWDHPVVVTSGVQFYESLFSDRPTKCRKLHNIANSVILIDEAQTIPLNLAIPILDALETLVKDWGCTVVLMSATQPAFNRLSLCDRAYDIVPGEQLLEQFQQLERVTYRLAIASPWTWHELANDIKASGQKQSLTVVNTTQLSREGYQELSNLVSGTWFHLSARMCPAHRIQVLQQVRFCLENQLPCHLISTQVIEAGVDVDFPRVYRQLGPLDSIIQAAGRCNRNGKLDKLAAITTVFKLDSTNQLVGEYQNRIEITRAILTKHPEALSCNILESVRQYFQQVYNNVHAGGKQIQKLRVAYNYPEVAKRFRVIDNDWQQSVVVPWKEGANLITELRERDVLNYHEWRQVQKYTIGLPHNYQAVEEYPNGLRVWLGKYDRNFGVTVN